MWSIFKCSLDHHGSFLFPGSQVSLLLLWELLVAFHAKFLLESFYLCWGMSSSEAMLMLGEVSNSGLHWTQFLATLPAVQCRGGQHLKLEWPDYKHWLAINIAGFTSPGEEWDKASQSSWNCGLLSIEQKSCQAFRPWVQEFSQEAAQIMDNDQAKMLSGLLSSQQESEN